MVSGDRGEHQKSLNEVEVHPTNHSNSQCLCKHDWSGTKLTETLYEDNISLSNPLKTEVETTSEGFDAANFDHRRNAFKTSGDP